MRPHTFRTAYHALAIRKQAHSPVAWLDADNTFGGNLQVDGVGTFNGTLLIKGMIMGKVGIGTAAPEQLMHLNVTPGNGEGMQIDSSIAGYAPAIYLNHIGSGGHKYRLASYGDNLSPGRFVIRDDSFGMDRFSIDEDGIIAGNGAGLTSLNAASVSSGTLVDARLSAKVARRDGGNAFTGHQTIAGNVGIGSASPQPALHVYSANSPTTIRVQSAGGFGAGRIEFLSDPQGSGSEWRPGYIQSTDNGGFAGGLSFVVNGTGFDNRFGEVETMRIVNGRVGIGTATPVSALQVVGTVTATAFNPPSDRNLKENFASVNPREVLEKVAALPISRWNFIGDAATPHVGPMAQDFHAAFRLGTDERHIATVDADGVALAAIQGLNQKVEAQLQAKNAEIKDLKHRLAKLETLILKYNRN